MGTAFFGTKDGNEEDKAEENRGITKFEFRDLFIYLFICGGVRQL